MFQEKRNEAKKENLKKKKKKGKIAFQQAASSCQ
jgi:hypothetical protein